MLTLLNLQQVIKMGELGKILLVILLSSVKFVAGPPFAYLSDRYSFSVGETILYCIIGGMLGVVVFSYFSQYMIMVWNKFLNLFRKKIKTEQQPFSNPVADISGSIEIRYEYISREKKLFTKRNRRIVKLWQRYGLIGIALITPIILSIPIGTIIANRLVDNRKKIFLYMFVSIVFWSIAMTISLEIFHAVNLTDLKEKIFR